jgi:tetratricopeptide (TPR) repeat protein
MGGYSAHEVAKMLGLSAARLRAYVRAGLLTPERGDRGELRFSFQDLLLLRTAEGLVKERIPPRRVRHQLQKLRARLPDARSLTGLQLSAEGDHVIVRDGDARWSADSGQVLLNLGEGNQGRADSEGVAISPFRRRPPSREISEAANDTAAASASDLSADELYELGCDLEENDSARARAAYLNVLALAPEHADAHVNLGRLLHEAGDYTVAEAHYRRALSIRPDDATATFNLGVALEDQGQVASALEAYERAVLLNDNNADAHYNAARLYEKTGEYTAAVRHLRAYRRLIQNR